MARLRHTLGDFIEGARRSVGRNEFLGLLFLFLVAFVIRVIGIDWGLPEQNFSYSRFEADEPGVLFASLALSKGAYYTELLKNYPFFYYLSFVVFAVYYSLGALFGIFSGWSEFIAQYIQDTSQLLIVGRLINVSASSLTVVLTYFVGRRMFGKSVGALASLFMVLSFGDIFYSSVFRLDSFLPLPFLLTFFLLIRLKDAPSRRLRPYVLLSIALIIAVSTKITAWALLVPVLLVPIYIHRRITVGRLKFVVPERRYVFALYMSGAFYLALIAPSWSQLLSIGQEVGRRAVDKGLETGNPSILSPFKYGLPWHLIHNLPLEMGITIYPLALLGLVLMIREKQVRFAVVLMYVTLLAYLLPIGYSSRATWRDMLPILPFLAIAAGYGLRTLVYFALEHVGRFRTQRSQHYALAIAAAALLILPISSLYRQKSLILNADTRDLAKEWIEQNIAPGSRIAVESYGPSLVVNDYSDGFRTFFDGNAAVVTAAVEATLSYEVLALDWDISLQKDLPDPDRLLPYLEANDVEYVVLSSGYYGRFYNEAVDVHHPEQGLSGRLLHDTIESNLELSQEFIPNWKDRPGPVIKIYKVPEELPEVPTVIEGSFDPFPGMDRPASAVGYYQFSPR